MSILERQSDTEMSARKTFETPSDSGRCGMWTVPSRFKTAGAMLTRLLLSIRRTVLRDVRLKWYRMRYQKVMLDRLSVGDPMETLKEAAAQMEPGQVLYICDRAHRFYEKLTPDVQIVYRQNLMRWLERTGFEHLGSREEGSKESRRIYATARRA